jgi:branched-chain amino acid transport system substrate-binding protein
VSGPAKPAGKGKPIKIGLLLASTGNAVLPSREASKGVMLVLEQAGWKVAGRDIVVIEEDDQGKPVPAVEKARKLVEQDKVDVIMGCIRSDAAEALQGYIGPLGIPYIIFSAHHRSLVEKPNVISWSGLMAPTSYPLGRYAYEKLGFKTASVLTPDYVAGRDFCGGFIDGFKAAGGTIVQEQRLPMGVMGSMDFSSYITAIKKADCVAFWIAGTLVPFVKQYNEYGLKMPLILTFAGTAQEEIMTDLGDLGLGMYCIHQYTPLIDTEANKKFVDAHEKKYQRTPGLFTGYALGGTSILLKALEATRGDTTPKVLLKALTNVSVDTAQGHAEVKHPDGVGEADIYITKCIKIGDRYSWQPIQKIPKVGRPYPGYRDH